MSETEGSGCGCMFMLIFLLIAFIATGPDSPSVSNTVSPTSTGRVIKTLNNLDVQGVEIRSAGNEAEAVAAAIRSELIARGAKMSARKGAPGVFLKGTSFVQTPFENPEIQGVKPNALQVELSSSDGTLAATAWVDRLDVSTSDGISEMARVAAERICDQFARQR